MNSQLRAQAQAKTDCGVYLCVRAVHHLAALSWSQECHRTRVSCARITDRQRIIKMIKNNIFSLDDALMILFLSLMIYIWCWSQKENQNCFYGLCCAIPRENKISRLKQLFAYSPDQRVKTFSGIILGSEAKCTLSHA